MIKFLCSFVIFKIPLIIYLWPLTTTYLVVLILWVHIVMSATHSFSRKTFISWLFIWSLLWFCLDVPPNLYAVMEAVFGGWILAFMFDSSSIAWIMGVSAIPIWGRYTIRAERVHCFCCFLPL